MTGIFRAIALATAFSLIAITSAFSVSVDEGGPSFWVETAELDLGTVIAGSVTTATFVFHNDGPEDVHIIRAKPS